MPFVSTNPNNNQVAQVYASPDIAHLGQTLEMVRRTQQTWAQIAFTQRAEILRNVGARLQAQRDRYARLITQEMGKPLREARAEVEK